MPWNQSTPMDEKTKFIADHLRGTFSISELCTNYGISRKTAYKWLAEQLGIHVNDCHIGEFDVATCRRVAEICKTKETENG